MVDLLKIKVKAGAGGDGVVSWHHEKFKPKGGPDGGNGGNGGSIYLVADTNLLTLADLASRYEYKAKPGNRGGKNNKSGRGAADLVIKVPVGTLVSSVIPGATTGDPEDRGSSGSVTSGDRPKDDRARVVVADLVEPNQKVLVAQGGTGGRGNESFKSATHQRPMEFTVGTPGESKELILELKILADVGLIGLPNAGKSTLLNALTSARAVIGAYPFTTLEPNLGILRVGAEPQRGPLSGRAQPENIAGTARCAPTIVVADIPGLIAGAAQGKGIGDEFLRHIERCKVLVHLLNVGAEPQGGPLSGRALPEIAADYKTIRRELAEWSSELLKKPEIIVFSQIDLQGDPGFARKAPTIGPKLLGKDAVVCAVSAVTGEGLDKLKEEIIKALVQPVVESTAEIPEPPKSTKIFTLNTLPNKRMVFIDRDPH